MAEHIRIRSIWRHLVINKHKQVGLSGCVGLNVGRSKGTEGERDIEGKRKREGGR